MTAKLMTLHCEVGHDWQRPSQRGKPPRRCPKHAEVKPPRPVAVRVVHTEGDADPYPVDEYPLVCYVDPDYVAPEPADPEAIRRANITRANHRIDKLENRLKLFGLHISQHS